MPGLTPPTQEEINAWHITELGTEDGTSPTVSFDAGGSIATREILCDWTRRYEVARWFVGQVSTYTESDVTHLTRLVPQKLPKPAGEPIWVPDFYATKIVDITGHAWRDFDPGAPDYEGPYYSVENPGSFPVVEPGEGEEDLPKDAWGNVLRDYEFTPETINKYLCAKIKIQYERLPFFVEIDEGTTFEYERYTQYIPKPSQPEYITVPASVQKYLAPAGSSYNVPAGHLVPVPYSVGLVESSYRFILKWHRLPYENAWGPGTPLWNRVFGDGTTSNLPYLNAVNSHPFWGFPAGTVMLEEVTDEAVPVLLEEGLFSWNLDFHFWVKPGRHNWQWYFPNAKEEASAEYVAKRMFVARGSTYYVPGAAPPDNLPDLRANYIERDLNELFNIADIES